MSEAAGQHPGPRARFNTPKESYANTENYVARGRARVYNSEKTLNRTARMQPPSRAIGRAEVKSPWELDLELIRNLGRTLSPQERQGLDSGDLTRAQILQNEQQRGNESLFGPLLPRHPVDPSEVV